MTNGHLIGWFPPQEGSRLLEYPHHGQDFRDCQIRSDLAVSLHCQLSLSDVVPALCPGIVQGLADDAFERLVHGGTRESDRTKEGPAVVLAK